MAEFGRLPNYIKRLGPWEGARVFRLSRHAQAVAQAPVDEVRVGIPGVKAALRRTHADHATFFQVMIKRQYRMADFPQHADLQWRYQESLRSGQRPLIIDAGANIGLATIWFAHHFPEALIVSIEPDEENLKVLQRNALPYANRVHIVRAGLWSRTGSLRISNPDAGSAAFRVEMTDSTDLLPSTFPAVSIDDICADVGVSHPLIVKLDVEGAQQFIFAERTEWMDRSACICLELDDWLMPWRGTSRPFFRALAPLEFDFLLGDESIFCFNQRVLRPTSPAA